MKLIHRLLYPLLLLGLVACQSTNDKQTITPENSAATVSLLQGTYLANLPCKNCHTIQINLTLDSDRRFDMIAEFINSGEIVATQQTNGQWDIKNNIVTLTSTSESSDDKKRTYTSMAPAIKALSWQKNKLLLLDKIQKPFLINAKRYQFEKK